MDMYFLCENELFLSSVSNYQQTNVSVKEND